MLISKFESVVVAYSTLLASGMDAQGQPFTNGVDASGNPVIITSIQNAQHGTVVSYSSATGVMFSLNHTGLASFDVVYSFDDGSQTTATAVLDAS